MNTHGDAAGRGPTPAVHRRESDSSARPFGERLVAGVVLTLTLPLLAISLFALKLESAGPIVVAQQRTDGAGDAFTVYRLRTTRIHDGSVRPTHVGQVLRATSLDEVPMFWSVLKGDATISEILSA